MQLSKARQPYVIPSYSLTGDLLAYLKCGLQYRYHNRGALPPSKPVQLWFGEFVHAVMEEAYRKWSHGLTPTTFPWDWGQHIRPIELEIARRLAARGLLAPVRLFCPHDGSNARCLCEDASAQNHKLIASRRTEAAINTWAPHLFPLISEAEVRLQGIRPMPVQGEPRSDHYEISGVVDVIGSVRLTEAPRGNLILHYLCRHSGVQKAISNVQKGAFEIILDYKGTRRPSKNSEAWQHYSWQLLTYAWLRGQQPGTAPVMAGIILFINELEPSQEDMEELKQEVQKNLTDVLPTGGDHQKILSWGRKQRVPTLTRTFREERSIRIIPVDHNAIIDSLGQFDAVVEHIESAVLLETRGQRIVSAWQKRHSGSSYIPEARTCTVCDFKHYCPLAPKVGEGGPPAAP